MPTRSLPGRMRTRLPACLSIATAALAAAPQAARAQCPTVGTAAVTSATNGSVTANLCMQVQDVLRLTTTSTLAPPANLTSTSYTKAGSGSTTWVPFGGKVNVNVAANRAFVVTVEGSFTPTSKNATDAVWNTTASGWSATRTVAASNVAANRRIQFLTTPGANASWSQDVFFASRWFWETDRAGTYTLDLKFTLSTP